MSEQLSNFLSVAKFVTNVSSDLSTSKTTAKSNQYRASLAEENARRADILHLERTERLNKEGLLDAGLFQMRMEASGLSGVSAELWNRQRYADATREVEKAQSTRSSVVQRFLREQRWLQQNATNSEVSGLVSSFGRGLTLAHDLWGDKKEMATLDLKQTSIEPLAPDKDPVSDAVNPIGGLKTVTQGLEDLQKTYKDRRSEYIRTQAMNEFLEKSTANKADYYKYITTLDTSDITSIEGKMDAYAQDKHAGMSRFIESVEDRETRNQLRTFNNNDFVIMRSKGLEFSLGIMKQHSITQINDGIVHASTSITLDPSNENRLAVLKRIDEQIDASGLSPDDKMRTKRDSRKTLNEVQARTILSRTPERFEGPFDIVSNPSASVKDPLSPVEVAEGSSEKRVELNEEKVCTIDGVDGWNELDHKTRLKLLREHETRTNRELSKEKSRITQDVKRITERALAGEITVDFDQVSSLSNLLKGMKPEDAQATRNSLLFVKEMSAYVPVAQAGTDDEFEKILVDLQASGATEDPRIISLISIMGSKLLHLRKESKKHLSENPHGWGLKYNRIAPLNLTAGNFGNSLASYSLFAQETEKKHGVVVNGVGTAGEKQLMDLLQGKSSADFVKFIKSETDELCKEDKERAKHVSSRLKNKVLSSVLLLAMRGEEEAAGTVAIGIKSHEDITSQYKAKSGLSFDTHYDRLINREIGGLYHGLEDASYKGDAEAIKYYIIGSMKASGNTKLSSEVVKDAVTAVLGNTPVKVNGSYVLPPRNMSHTEFWDRLHSRTSDKLTHLFGDKSSDRYPEKYGYQTEGNGKYSLTFGGVVKKDKHGNPIIIDIYDELPSKSFYQPPSFRDSIQAGLGYWNALYGWR